MAESESFRISRITAEFVDSEVELAFRVARHEQVVRDIRISLGGAVLVSLILAVSDFLSMGASEEFHTLLNSRITVCLLLFLAMMSAGRLWRSLMDGVTQTGIEIIGVSGFISVTLLRPYEPGWHGMSMLLILFGLYIFVPNRFTFALGVALIGSLAFVILLDSHFQLAGPALFNLCVLLTTANLLGARACYRNSWRMRDEYRSAEQRRLLSKALTRERDLRSRMQAEQAAAGNNDPIAGTISREHFQDVVDRTLSARLDSAVSTPITLVALELDYFKQIVDTYGRQHSAAILMHLVRHSEVLRQEGNFSLARMGEAAFAVLRHDRDQQAAFSMAERLRAELNRSPLRLPVAAVYISASVGIAQWRPGETADMLIRRAIDALAKAKAKGGNWVELAEASDLSPLQTARRGAQYIRSLPEGSNPSSDRLPECP